MKTYWNQLFLAGLGGFLGSAARFALSGFVHRLVTQAGFPYVTLTVNVLGCLAIGFLGGLMEVRQVMTPSQRIFLLIGVLGGFTTFSTFVFESIGLLHASEIGKAAMNVILHVMLGFLAAYAGYQVAQTL